MRIGSTASISIQWRRRVKSVIMNYLMGTAVENADVLVRHDVNGPILNVAQLDKVWLKRQNQRVAEGKVGRSASPVDPPLRPGPPAVAVDKEGKLRVIEQ